MDRGAYGPELGQRAGRDQGGATAWCVVGDGRSTALTLLDAAQAQHVEGGGRRAGHRDRQDLDVLQVLVDQLGDRVPDLVGRLVGDRVAGYSGPGGQDVTPVDGGGGAVRTAQLDAQVEPHRARRGRAVGLLDGRQGLERGHVRRDVLEDDLGRPGAHGAVGRGERRGDRDRVRRLAQRSGDAYAGVPGDAAHDTAGVGHLEGAEHRVLLHVHGRGGVRAEAGAAVVEQRVAEGDRDAVADERGGPHTGEGDVAVGQRGRVVAARHDVSRVPGSGRGGRPTDAQPGAGQALLHPLEGLAGGQAAAHRTAHRHPEEAEALPRLGDGDLSGRGDVLRERRGGCDDAGRRVARLRGAGLVDQRQHRLRRCDAGDGAPCGQRVGHRADQAAVRGVHGGTGHACPDPARAVDGRAGQLGDDHVYAGGDAVVDATEDRGLERVGGGAALDRQSRTGQPVDGLLGRERIGALDRSRGRRPRDRAGQHGDTDHRRDEQVRTCRATRHRDPQEQHGPPWSTPRMTAAAAGHHPPNGRTLSAGESGRP